MATDNFRSFETDGTDQRMIPLLATEKVMVKPIKQPDGVALLLRNAHNSETNQPAEPQWFLTRSQAQWLADHITQSLNDNLQDPNVQDPNVQNTT